MEGRIKRLERDWDHPAHPGPDPETVAHWASLWTEAGMEESQSTALALEFLEYCQMMGKAPAFGYLVMWLKGNIGSGEDGGGSGEGRGAAVY